jgi:hypothetical protein
MSGTSWVGGGGKKPSSRPPSRAYVKKKRAEFNTAWNKKKSKYY